MVSYLLQRTHQLGIELVLILIVVEDGLVLSKDDDGNIVFGVLILIVVEDGLVLDLIRHY